MIAFPPSIIFMRCVAGSIPSMYSSPGSAPGPHPRITRPASDLIQHRVAVGDMERMVVRQAEQASAQHYPARALRRRSK